MAVIPKVVIRRRGEAPSAIIITVSKQLYEKYIMSTLNSLVPIPAEIFRQFLLDKNVPFHETESVEMIYGETFFTIGIHKESSLFAAEDIKVCLSQKDCPVTYIDFIDYYAEKLKSI